MIPDAIIGFFNSGWGYLLQSIPAPSHPGWWSQSADAVLWLLNTLGQLGNWVPLGLISSVITFIFTMWLVSGGIVIGRMALSLFTGGGGNAVTS